MTNRFFDNALHEDVRSVLRLLPGSSSDLLAEIPSVAATAGLSLERTEGIVRLLASRGIVSAGPGPRSLTEAGDKARKDADAGEVCWFCFTSSDLERLEWLPPSSKSPHPLSDSSAWIGQFVRLGLASATPSGKRAGFSRVRRTRRGDDVVREWRRSAQ